MALEADSYRTLLRAAPEAGVAGGRTYEAVIAACAVAGSAETLLTFNASHFALIPMGSVQVVVPGTRVR